jgi:hypothetical protein
MDRASVVSMCLMASFCSWLSILFVGKVWWKVYLELFRCVECFRGLREGVNGREEGLGSFSLHNSSTWDEDVSN